MGQGKGHHIRNHSPGLFGVWRMNSGHEMCAVVSRPGLMTRESRSHSREAACWNHNFARSYCTRFVIQPFSQLIMQALQTWRNCFYTGVTFSCGPEVWNVERASHAMGLLLLSNECKTELKLYLLWFKWLSSAIMIIIKKITNTSSSIRSYKC